jgi:hypothetical protein
LEKDCAININIFHKLHQELSKEIEICKQNSENVSSESQKIENKCEIDENLKYLKEIIIALELQIRRMTENVCSNKCSF